MTLTSHAATGAIVALIVKQPALVLPLAFVSHFALDMLPHFGYPGGKGYGESIKHRLTYLYLVLDGVGLIALASILNGSQPLVYWAAFAAILPDLMQSIRYFFIERKSKQVSDRGRLVRLFNRFGVFHRRIQYYQYPSGIIPEFFIAILLLGTLNNLI